MKTTAVVLHHPADEVIIDHQPCIYAKRGMLYLMVPPNLDSPAGFFISLHDRERKISEWIRSYDNVLKGLHYWRARALSK
jgi:hypothetical protein